MAAVESAVEFPDPEGDAAPSTVEAGWLLRGGFLRFPMGLETVVEDGRPFVALRAGDPALNKWASPLPLRARPLARCPVLVHMQRLGLAKVEELGEEQAKAQDAEDFAGQSIEEENPAEIMGLAFAPPKRRKRSKCVEMKEK